MTFINVCKNKIMPMFYVVCSPQVKTILKFLALFFLTVWSLHAFADPSPGTDMLAGTDSGVEATLQGTGKKYIYIIEGVVAIAGFIKSRNPMVFGGLVVIAVVINIIFHFIGS